MKWAVNCGKAVIHVRFVNGTPVLPNADDGPVPVLLAPELTLARSGGPDAALSAQQPFYGTDFTKPLIFINDGGYYSDQATSMNLVHARCRVGGAGSSAPEGAAVDRVRSRSAGPAIVGPTGDVGPC